VQLDVVPQPHVVKGAESDATVQKGLLVCDVAGCFHVVEVDFDEAGRGGAFDFDLMPFAELPGSAGRRLFGNGDAGSLVDEKDLIRVRIRFLAEVNVVEISRILIAKDQAHIAVAAGFLRRPNPRREDKITNAVALEEGDVERAAIRRFIL